MERRKKILIWILSASFFSVCIIVGAYFHLNLNKNGFVKYSGFKQNDVHLASYNVATGCTDFTVAAEQSVNAVVHIKSIVKSAHRRNNIHEYYNFDPFDFFFDSPDFQYKLHPKIIGFGSGVIVSLDGYVVTNNHVVDGADEVEVVTNDNRTYIAKIVGRDESTDIALLKINGGNFPVIPFGNSDSLKIGEWVLAVGNPFNLTSTVTAGIVSAKGRGNVFSEPDNKNSSAKQSKVESFIQTDAAVNPGNSGGALVNTKGELVGINTAIYSETGNFVGYSFAVPVNLVKKVIFDIKKFGGVQKALLGLIVMDLDSLKDYDPVIYNKLKIHDGVFVEGFTSKSSSKKAGIKRGDVIIAVNGVKIKNYQGLMVELTNYNPGRAVDIQVFRNGDIKICTVILKNDQGIMPFLDAKNITEILGATFKELSIKSKEKLGISYGLEVRNIKHGKLKSAGVKDGFIILKINDVKINSKSDLIMVVKELLKRYPNERCLYIKGFYPDYGIRFYAIDMSK